MIFEERDVILMKKMFRSILLSGRNRRCRLVGVIIFILRLILDIEKDEMWRNSDLLENFDHDSYMNPRRNYQAIEEEYDSCEYIVGTLESAIEELEFVY